MIRSICVAGSGTAGNIFALMLKKAFPTCEIIKVHSPEIGIVGVGEGSTEHWKVFMNICDIPLGEMIVECSATHKLGIRFEGWTKHTPDYFHSISGNEHLNNFGLMGLYCGLNENNKLLTNSISYRGLIEHSLHATDPHQRTNQFHFDTFKLNKYFEKLCIQRNIKLIEAEITKVNINPDNGNVASVSLSTGVDVSSDIFIDATGFRRVLMSSMGANKWRSYSRYLPMNAAIAFPSELPENRKINPYTRAIAKSAGWMWEIPTQERRGNGYVYCSDFISEEEAIQEASEQVGFNVQPARKFVIDPGCLEKQWVNNVISAGLCSSFVEPLEATSIGSTVQQALAAVRHLAGYNGNPVLADRYNSRMDEMMENLVSMISLHYISDRDDSEFWKNAASLPRPEYLEDLLELWSVRPPADGDIKKGHYELFHEAHFWHVAQGQGLISKDGSSRIIDMLDIRQAVNKKIWEIRVEQTAHPVVDHLEALLALKE